MIDYKGVQQFFQVEENNFAADVATKYNHPDKCLNAQCIQDHHTGKRDTHIYYRFAHIHFTVTQILQIRQICQ